MTTVTQIIDDAFRASNLVATGASPTLIETEEALRLLSRIVKSTFGFEAGEPFSSIPIGSNNIERPSGYPWYETVPDNDWFVPENVRVMLNLGEPVSLYLHPAPNNGARFALLDVAQTVATHNVTVVGNGNRIDGLESLVLDENGTAGEWFYREDLGSWIKYTPLVLENEFPFPEEFDDFFVMTLAMRINPLYGSTIDGQSGEMLRRSKSQLRARYAQEINMPVNQALLRMSRMTADRNQWRDRDGIYDPSTVFARGYPL